MSAISNEALVFWRAAERDRITFDILSAAVNAPLENLCFNAQQYVEKLLKAALTLHGVAFRRTHDIAMLAQLLTAAGSDLPAPLDALKNLMPCAVLARYADVPFVDIDRNELTRLVAGASQWATKLSRLHSLP
ncbi:MAG: HEPN domain-containing protein [Sulfuritalea sp.]|jgi:HEPN domain-containing protein|nr:HEPN domain-containing protein [Sulfuritalea sp.]MDP1984500.1 HEPN domain-containing protein [Sulfuritalea sp.]